MLGARGRGRFRGQEQRGTVALAAAFLVAAIGIAAAPAFASNSVGPDSGLNSVPEAMYNAEYSRAILLAKNWVQEHPDDIRAWNYLAEAILDQEMLKENMYNGAAFLNSGKVFRRREAPLAPSFEKRLNATLDHAQQLEEALLGRNSDDEEALYWLGVTHSTRTEYLFALQRSYFAALMEGKRAWQANERVARMDPQFADADLVIGVGDYAAALLPWYLRMVTSLAGIHGSRKRGMRELERASRDGRYTQVDAKTVLIMIYERRKQYPQALALLAELAPKYPHNFLIDLEVGRIHKAQGDWNGAAAAYDAAVEKFVHGNLNPDYVPRALILFRDGEAHEHLGDLDRALKLYHEAGEVTGGDRAVYEADLAAARLDQRFNHKERARREYQLVADAIPGTDLGGAAREALESLR